MLLTHKNEDVRTLEIFSTAIEKHTHPVAQIAFNKYESP